MTPLGWCVVGVGVAAWILGGQLGWVELDYAAAACLMVLVLAALFTIGRSELSIDVRLAPPRVVVGAPAAGEVMVRNISGRRLLPLPVELPVGAGLARFDLPALAGGAQHEDVFIVPTNRRAVISVGPATSVRSDPLGLLRREVVFSEMTELFVHPRTAMLNTLGSGFLRDLEGNTTDAISPSDLAFHSLRRYVPGDDRRHVHWRTTARLTSGDLMVRQFLDTRRSHLVLVLDGNGESYADDDELELAVSAAASLAIRAVRDEQDVSIIPGELQTARGGGARILDVFSRFELAEKPTPLPQLALHAARNCADASIAMLVTGSRAELSTLRRAGSRFDTDTATIALVAATDATSGIQRASGLRVVTVASLGDLARLTQGAIPA